MRFIFVSLLQHLPLLLGHPIQDSVEGRCQAKWHRRSPALVLGGERSWSCLLRLSWSCGSRGMGRRVGAGVLKSSRGAAPSPLPVGAQLGGPEGNEITKGHITAPPGGVLVPGEGTEPRTLHPLLAASFIQEPIAPGRLQAP